MIVLKKLTVIVCCLAIPFLVSSVANAQKPLAIKGGKIITMNGDPIENGTILFRDGKIVDVGLDLKIPVEAKVIDATGKVVMPGFVEPHSSSGMSQANETNPLVPYVSVLDSIDPMSTYFVDARRNGVTSVAITPGNSTMIGGQAAVIKTGGEFVDDMVLKPDVGVKISLQPVSGSRMSHLANLRKALDDAKRKMEGKNDAKQANDDKGEETQPVSGRGRRGGRPESPREDSDGAIQDDPKETEKEKTDPKKEEPVKPESELDKAMFALLSGKLPAIIYCDQAMDVGQALRLIKEYNLTARLVLGKECYKAAAEVAKSGLPVILDDTLVFWEEDPRTKEETKIVLPQIFRDHNVKFAFQVGRENSSTLGTTYLWYQAATCVKYGMPEQEALEALTILPAKFLGVDKFVGSIEKGKDGDVIILSGDPLKVGTWVETTIVGGDVVYEREKDEQLKRLLGQEPDSE
jgi:imidazolonepropionase-like amidohydrolase